MSEGKKQHCGDQAAKNGMPVGDLVAVAHELKTPLAIISHLASSLEDDFLLDTAADRKEALQRIRLSADRTLRLVQGLTISHRLNEVDQLAFYFELEPLNATQICQEVIHEILPFAEAYRQKVNFTAPFSPQLVVGNSELIRGVFFNLIDNAIKHNPPNTEVNICVRRRDAAVRTCVQDNGPGLSAKDMRRLRQTLGYSLQPLQGRANSSGIGLYIASQMAQAMGGKLGVGHAQTGADFHVDLIHSRQLSLL